MKQLEDAIRELKLFIDESPESVEADRAERNLRVLSDFLDKLKTLIK